MRVHSDWSTPGFATPPLAANVGPFGGAAFLEIWSNHFARGNTPIVESDTALIVLHEEPGRLSFAGHADVTDYHVPRGEGVADLVAAYLAELKSPTHVIFDSLLADDVAEVAAGLALGGIEAEPVLHEVTQVVELPPAFGEYLAGLDKKHRHEMRRKRRRFEAALGPARLERREGSDAVTAFIEMHRRSDGEKGSFMDATMASFFVELADGAGGVLDVLVAGDDRPHAVSFGFEEDDTYYLYNSAYEPEDIEHSPGIVLLEMVIRSAIFAGRTRLDLLKGDEPYKHRLGAVSRPLYLVSGFVGERS